MPRKPPATTLLAACILTLLPLSTAAAQSPSAPPPPGDRAAACSALQHLRFPGIVSLASQPIPAGNYAATPKNRIPNLPPFCRVHLIARPAPQSAIQIELWLPQAGWNGRFLGTGNGGGAGSINYGGMGGGLRRGFATANTDLGTAPSANDLAAYPDKWADFGYRATHLMTTLSKVLVAAYYGHPAKRSYFVGCSTGGQQAMSEAQRYPTDYNGIVAGAPANNRTHLHSEFLWTYQATHKAGAKSLLPAPLLAQITRAVVAACAGRDGGAPSDNFLTDPRVCRFAPASLPLCSAGSTAACLTSDQLAAIRTIYAGPSNPRTGQLIYAPLPFGAEASDLGIGFQENWPDALSLMYPFQWALGTNFNPMAFDFDRDEDRLDQKLASVLNANNPDLTAFQKQGGKLIMFTGTADPIVPFPDAIHYYERVIDFEKQHPQPGNQSDPLAVTQTFFRYYLVPGMGHCGGGPGLNSIGQNVSNLDNDLLSALQLWSEHDQSPAQLPATGWVDGDRTKPVRLMRNICSYPEFPVYVGGPADKKASFQCKARPRGEVLVPANRYLH